MKVVFRLSQKLTSHLVIKLMYRMRKTTEGLKTKAFLIMETI